MLFRSGAISEAHALAVGVVGSNGGTPETRAIVDQADLVVFVGCRAGSVSTERWRHPAPGKVKVIHLDVDAQVIVARSVTNKQNDIHELPPMLEQIKANTGRQAHELSADVGYCSEANLRELSRRHVRGYVATGRQKHGSALATGQRTKGPRARAMAARLKRGGLRSRYRLRKQTVEPVFGQIKEARGFRGFLLRGLQRVEAEIGRAHV